VIGFILAISVVVTPAPSPNYPPDRNCDSGDDRETADCTWDQYQAWDKALNAEYKAVLNRAPSEVQPLIVKSQRAWIQYRDANCAIRSSRPGVVAAYFANQCLLDMTRDRTKELHGLLDEIEG
jgi:uncharacterized protein YecT (DUF1311 family)